MSEQAAERRKVTIEMPAVELVCPYCGNDDTHSGAIFEPGVDYLFATGQTHCDKCEQWFDVCVE